MLGFFDFCSANNLIALIRQQHWGDFGQRYNGDGATYGPKIAKAFEHKEALAKLPKIPNPVP